MDKKQTRLLKIKNGSRTALFSVVIFFVFILILEVVLRTTHLFNARVSYSTPDNLLGWCYKPNSSYWNNKENDHPISGKFNSFGWRDKERSIEKPEGTYRVAVIGDSFVEAMQVELDSTFLAIAEKQLKKDFVEIMNFGRSGMTQTEELLVLKNKVSPFSPDLVVLFFLPSNDIKDVNRKTALSNNRPYYNISDNGSLLLDTSFNKTSAYKLKALISPIKQHSAIISLVAERFNYLLKHKGKRNITNQNITNQKKPKNKLGGFLTLCTATPGPTYLKNYRLCKRLIKEMATYCKEKKIKFMLVDISNHLYHPEKVEQYKTIDLTFNDSFIDKDLEDFSASIDIEYLGLRKPFREYYEKEGKELYRGRGHWNYLGHRLVAKEFTQKIKTLIIPKEG